MNGESGPPRVGVPPDRPVVVFDGDCGFCRFWIERWRHRSGGRVDFEPFQSPEIARRFPEIPRERFAFAVHLIEPDGRVSQAAEAVVRLDALGGRPALRWAYERVPGVAAVTERAYRTIADHRSFSSRVTSALWGGVAAPCTYRRSTWLFLRLLGVVYLIAFWSLGGQILGLIGHDGILPADQFMADARTLAGFSRYWRLPTLAWFDASDGALQALCLGGSTLALLLVTGVLPMVVLPLLWLFYLSLSIVSQDFLGYQWDALLLEVGFLAIFLAPATWRERWRTPADPPRVARWLLLWLLFRLMAGSGLIKLASGDVTWHQLTALAYHFETQPIPTPLAWYAHWLPAWFLAVSTLAVLAVEIGVPFLIPAPRRLRALAFVLLAGLQVPIALTGNYAFFNVLTAALCLLLLDDTALALPSRAAAPAAAPPRRGILDGRAPVNRARRRLLLAVALLIVPVSAARFMGPLGVEPPGSALVDPLARAIAPFRSVNSYGLFAVMTTTRPEIVIEGSEDGATWLEYEFRYKAGDLRRAPPWVAPHQPRLDWQMWFAALGRFDSEPWFEDFCVRLLEADDDVLQLLARDPFDGRRPRSVRAVLYRYRFSDDGTRRRDGVWWTRERLGAYSPTLTLRATP
jgi:predicted DCC family thiol-disulfide oxidoreductase YuxK